MPTVVKSYSASGAYVVTVTVTDDLGQQGSTSLSVTVGSGIVFPQPPFTVSPTTPLTGQTVSFNASGVTGLQAPRLPNLHGTSVMEPPRREQTRQPHTHNSGSYVRLTVTDSAGRTGTATVSVSVSTP